jgi:hypothetical protein
MSTVACIKCGEPLVDSSRPCGFCVSQIRHNAVAVLVANQGESPRRLLARANAVDALRILGHSQEEVVHARARAFDGHSVEQILSGLCGGWGWGGGGVKKASVDVRLDPRCYGEEVGRLRVNGFACEIGGRPMVVHRALRNPTQLAEAFADGRPTIFLKKWVVTEPESGAALTSVSWRTRAEAIDRSQERFDEYAGGAERFERVIQEMLSTEAAT